MAEQGNQSRRGRGRRDVVEGDGNREFERVVRINRVAAVVKGGRRFSFSAVVVVGNGDGEVGVGFGKAREVPSAVEKALKDGRRRMIPIARKGTTIPYQVLGRFGGARVILVPASDGTGVIAGEAVRSVLECAGIKNVLTKSIGNTNKLNLVKAALNGLEQLRSKEDLERLRGVAIELE